MKTKRKKFLKHPFMQRIIATFIAGYLLLVRWTCRWERQGFDYILPYWETGKPLIVVFWHNRMAMAPFAWQPKNPFFMLISPHSDGALIAKVIRYFGIFTLVGTPSHQGGAQALRSLVARLKQGASIGLTPDGPRGPCEVLKEGVFMAALASQCDVLALSFWTSRHLRLASWDRFFFPLPFSRGRLVWSAPISPPKHKHEKKSYLAKVRQALEEVTDKSGIS